MGPFRALLIRGGVVWAGAHSALDPFRGYPKGLRGGWYGVRALNAGVTAPTISFGYCPKALIFFFLSFSFGGQGST